MSLVSEGTVLILSSKLMKCLKIFEKKNIVMCHRKKRHELSLKLQQARSFYMALSLFLDWQVLARV